MGTKEWLVVGAAVAGLVWWNRGEPKPHPTLAVPVRQGDLATHGGTPNVRRPFVPSPDNPATTNDESNDQTREHFGTITLYVTNVSSGNSYPLDADVDGTELHRLYFPKGGWLDFIGCELEEDLTGTCEDEQGREWEMNGGS